MFSISYVCSEQALQTMLPVGVLIALAVGLLRTMERRKVSMSTSVGGLQAIQGIMGVITSGILILLGVLQVDTHMVWLFFFYGMLLATTLKILVAC